MRILPQRSDVKTFGVAVKLTVLYEERERVHVQATLQLAFGQSAAEPLKLKRNILSPYRAVNSLRLGYKNQSLSAV
jgi:hypothetical protein